jgi:hypothetical protein
MGTALEAALAEGESGKEGLVRAQVTQGPSRSPIAVRQVVDGLAKDVAAPIATFYGVVEAGLLTFSLIARCQPDSAEDGWRCSMAVRGHRGSIVPEMYRLMAEDSFLTCPHCCQVASL